MKMSLGFNEQVLECTLTKSQKISKILEPLRLLSGIDGLLYYTITSKGLFTFMGTHPSWMEEYYHEQYYLHNPFLCHPSTVSEGLHFPNTVRDEQYLEMLHLRRKKINADHAMMMITKNSAEMEGFCFFTKTENMQIYNFYMNELPLLRSFVEYFKREMSSEIIAQKKSSVNLATMKKELFFPNESKSIVTAPRRQAFFKAIGKDVEWLGSLKLTGREREILRLLKFGKTAQEIADTLFISRRTVEKYFETVKLKLHCDRRSEIFDRLIELEQLGILSFS
jgi:DNA-binding CsgD family transcriptional regulator